MKSWAQQTLERMSLEEKAGQVFILSLFSFDENSVERMLERIHKLKLGGVIQFQVTQSRLSEVIADYQIFVNIPLLVGWNGLDHQRRVQNAPADGSGFCRR